MQRTAPKKRRLAGDAAKPPEPLIPKCPEKTIRKGAVLLKGYNLYSNGTSPSSGPRDKDADSVVPVLAANHLTMLEVESGISPEIISQRGYYTATDPEELRKHGFADDQQRVPALVIPMYGPDGGIANHQIRPDDPRLNEDGKPIKYETPSKSGVVLDSHPSNIEQLKDPRVPLWITEGVRKGDSGASRGLVVVSLQGVWCWQRDKNPLPEWAHIPLANRAVYVAFDSDIVDKPPVRHALTELAEFLWSRGALVYVVPLEEVGEVEDA